jgi:hypothetical protein
VRNKSAERANQQGGGKSEIFTGRTEGEKQGFVLPPASLVLRYAPFGAASNQTF